MFECKVMLRRLLNTMHRLNVDCTHTWIAQFSTNHLHSTKMQCRIYKRAGLRQAHRSVLVATEADTGLPAAPEINQSTDLLAAVSICSQRLGREPDVLMVREFEIVNQSQVLRRSCLSDYGAAFRLSGFIRTGSTAQDSWPPLARYRALYCLRCAGLDTASNPEITGSVCSE